MFSTLLPGLVAGGTLIALLGGAYQYSTEKRFPSPKSLMRDFLLGAIMVSFLFQIIPESMAQMMSGLAASLPALPALSLFATSSGASDVSGGGGFDPELQIGMPKF